MRHIKYQNYNVSPHLTLFIRELTGAVWHRAADLDGLGTSCHPPVAPPCRLPSQASGLLRTVPDSQPLFFSEEDGLEPKAAVQKELSDMDYLKSKVVRAESPSSLEEEEEEEESEDEAVNCDEGSEAEDGDSCAAPNRQDRDRMEPQPEAGTPSGDRKPQEARAEVCVHWGVLGRPGR